MIKEQVITKHLVEHILIDAADLVEIRILEFMSDPSDPETLHKARVSIRTLRSLVRFIAPWQKRGQNKVTDKALRDVVRVTSRLRELDVLEDHIRSMRPEAAPDLLRSCADAAQNERLRVYNAFTEKQMQETLISARRAIHAIEWRSEIDLQGLAIADIQDHFDMFVQAQDERYDALDKEDVEATHAVRKRAKEVRYVAAKFKGLLAGETDVIVDHMKQVQDELGELCDARVNVGLLLDIPTEGLSVHARRNIAESLASNYAFIEGALADKEQVSEDDLPALVSPMTEDQ